MPPFRTSSLLRLLRSRFARFPGSVAYWEARYRRGGNSGEGSYARLAQFKAEVLNRFVADHHVLSVIEFGCGDGHQLSLAQYPSYIGLDVALQAIQLCRTRFADDPTKSFFLYHPEGYHDPLGVLQADLALSLDVLFHLVEPSVYRTYLDHLFGAARRFVGIYSSNVEIQGEPHERYRVFTDEVALCFPQWKLIKKVPNRYPYSAAAPVPGTSASDFYFYCREVEV